MIRIPLAALALAALSAPAYAQSCDPNTFSTDPTAAEWADLPVQDFSATTGLPTDWATVTETAPFVDGSLAYWGMIWVTTSWGIPSLDGQLFLASAMDIHLVPLAPTNKLGFRYASQWAGVVAKIKLSDGTTKEFSLDDQKVDGTMYGFGDAVGGYFGYCTAGTDLMIEEIYVSGGDGGIDDVRHGVAGGSSACADSLAEEVRKLGLDKGIENSMLAKVGASEASEARGKPDVSINQLTALLAEIKAQVGGKLTQEQADALMACVQAKLDALKG